MAFDFKFPKYSQNWSDISDSVKKRDGYKCRTCGARGFKADPPGSATLNACHIVSKRHGGKDIPSNLVTKCVTCHSKEAGHAHLRIGKKPTKRFIF